ncbi:MAG: hypothetical protein F6K17_18105 [Okeania sp. SIO3C4]|nr:hypothetical protein [Okeania sp. SIO3C4]
MVNHGIQGVSTPGNVKFTMFYLNSQALRRQLLQKRKKLGPKLEEGMSIIKKCALWV